VKKPPDSKPKSLKKNKNQKSVGSDEWMPHARLKLDTLGAVVTEMSRIYRLWLSRKMPGDEATKGTYMLRELRSGMEDAQIIGDIQDRLAALGALTERRRNA
jgi:hypothetical protein